MMTSTPFIDLLTLCYLGKGNPADRTYRAGSCHIHFASRAAFNVRGVDAVPDHSISVAQVPPLAGNT